MKKLLFTLVMIMAVSVTIHCYAAGAPKAQHPIDVFLEQQIAKDSSTVGMITSTTAALKLWDNEMKKYYKLIALKLNADQEKAFQVSQFEWTKFRDAETAFISSLYSKREGTMWRVVSSSSIMEITRKRALELINQYNKLSQN